MLLTSSRSTFFHLQFNLSAKNQSTCLCAYLCILLVFSRSQQISSNPKWSCCVGVHLSALAAPSPLPEPSQKRRITSIWVVMKQEATPVSFLWKPTKKTRANAKDEYGFCRMMGFFQQLSASLLTLLSANLFKDLVKGLRGTVAKQRNLGARSTKNGAALFAAALRPQSSNRGHDRKGVKARQYIYIIF